MLLFCPHCDEITEIFGLPTRPAPQCDCGGALEEVANDNAGSELAGLDHPAVARRLTADFAKLFPVAP